MKRALVCGVILLVSSLGTPSEAAAPKKFEKECVKSLSKSQRDRPRSEHESFCRCVTAASERLGFTRSEFAIERERIRRDPDGVASGRIRQINSMCLEDRSRAAPIRARL